MTELIQVLTTCQNLEQAHELASELVELRLAACCQILGPVQSVYRWQGQVETATEWQVWIKSSAAAWPQLQAVVLARHSYDTPELVVVEIPDGSMQYLDWLRAQLRPTDSSSGN